MMCGACTTMTTVGSLWTLQRPPRWQGPAPSTATLQRWVSQLKLVLFYAANSIILIWIPFVHCLSVHTAIKGPWSYDSCPFRKESTTKSSPNIMAKKRQWISGLLNKVKLLQLKLHFGGLSSFLDYITFFIFNHFMLSQNSRHRGAAWLLTCLNKRVSVNWVFFCIFASLIIQLHL